jgi:ADP-dependent phosphofructokinase/glucokinase
VERQICELAVAFVGCVRRWCVALLRQAGYHLMTRKLAQGIEYRMCLSLVAQSRRRQNAVEQAKVHVEVQAKAHAEEQVRLHVEERVIVRVASLRTAA